MSPLRVASRLFQLAARPTAHSHIHLTHDGVCLRSQDAAALRQSLLHMSHEKQRRFSAVFPVVIRQLEVLEKASDPAVVLEVCA